jgi:hypothetical protein
MKATTTKATTTVLYIRIPLDLRKRIDDARRPRAHSTQRAVMDALEAAFPSSPSSPSSPSRQRRRGAS